MDFRGFDSSIILIQRGGILVSHREVPGKLESSNLSRDNVSREIGRMHTHTPAKKSSTDVLPYPFLIHVCSTDNNSNNNNNMNMNMNMNMNANNTNNSNSNSKSSS